MTEKIFCSKGLRLALVFMLTGALSCLNAHAREVEPFNPYSDITPGVESFSMTKYGQISPSLYTGAMSLSIPIYTYNDPDFTIPLSLEYNFDGFRPAQSSGSVGYGWYLGCGGVITREVRGLPDEHVSSQTETGYSIINQQLNPLYNVVSRKGYWYTCTNAIGNIQNCPVRSINYKPQRNDIVFVSESHSLDLFSDLPVYYSESSGKVKFDTAPDIFHFAFNGHHGDFMLTDDGTVKVFNSDIPSGQVSVTFSPGSLQGRVIVPTIVISTGDGYSYTFGGDITAIDCSCSVVEGETDSTPDSFSGPTVSASAMRLTTITAPNGRTVTFGYSPKKQESVSLSVSRRGYRYDNSSMNTIPLSFLQRMAAGGQTLNMTDVSQESTQSTASYNSLPLWVKVDGIQTIVFNYQQRSYDESSSSCFLAYRPISSSAFWFPSLGFQTEAADRLSSIIVTNADGQTVESATLAHSYSSQHSRKLFLTGVTLMTKGGYTFNYDHLQNGVFPYNNTTGTDYWGYWNGKDNNPVLYQMLNTYNLGVCDLYDQINGTGKNPDPAYSRYGALTTVTYPTGGRSLMTYEGNTARIRIQNQDYEPSFENVQEFAAGGLRLSKTVHCKSLTERTDSVLFSYADGVLYQMPLYGVAVSYYHFRPLLTSVIPDENYSSTYTLRLEYTSDTHFHLSRENHIGYKTVTETYADGYRIVSRFSGAFDTNGYYDTYSGTDYDKGSFFCDDDYIDRLYGCNQPCVTPPTLDFSRMRGLLTEQSEYDSSNILKRRLEIGYSTDTLFHPYALYNSIYTYKGTYHEVYSPLESSQRETVFESGGQRVISSNIRYNSLCQTVCEEQFYGVPGDTVRLYRKYLHENSPAVLKGILSDAVKTRTSGGAEHLAATEHYSYGQPSVHNNPSSVCRYDLENDVTVTAQTVFSAGRSGGTMVTSFTYDSLMRPVQISLPGGDKVFYTWSGNNLTSKRNGNTSGSNITYYSWKDLVGLTSVTSPSGIPVSYGYDSRQRLKTVSDSEGRTMTQYDYKLNNDNYEL